jgi:hypothetical protein
MEDFVSESDSDYTSYWRDWVRQPLNAQQGTTIASSYRNRGILESTVASSPFASQETSGSLETEADI